MCLNGYLICVHSGVQYSDSKRFSLSQLPQTPSQSVRPPETNHHLALHYHGPVALYSCNAGKWTLCFKLEEVKQQNVNSLTQKCFFLKHWMIIVIILCLQNRSSGKASPYERSNPHELKVTLHNSAGWVQNGKLCHIWYTQKVMIRMNLQSF